jgi:preprotein translocase subunit SecY
MRINGTDIFMTRGDSETFVVRLEDHETGDQISFIAGDVVKFTVKASTQTATVLIAKVITEFEDGEARIHIEPADTNNLKYHTYVYDVQLNKQGNITTVIKPSKFVIEEEVTYE